MLLFLCFFVSRTLFSSELPRTNDGELHGARLANYYLALKQGQLPPRWAPNLNYGFGYPIFIFNYHSPYIAGTFFYMMGFSIERSLNLVVIVSVVGAGFGWYWLSFYMTQQKKVALTLSSLLLTAPYFLVNIFVRGAIGEIVFFGFTPWIILITQLLLKNKFQSLNLIYPLVVAAWVLSHQILSFIFLPLILWQIAQRKISNRLLKIRVFILLLTGLLLTSIFYIPTYFEKDLIKLSDDESVRNFQRAFVKPFELIWSNWNYGGMTGNKNEHFSFMIGPLLLIVISIIFFQFRQKTKMSQKFYFSMILLSLFLTTKYSESIWRFFPFLQYLQFPWRLIQLTLCSALLFIGFSWKELHLKNNYFHLMVLLSCVWIVLISVFWAKPISYISNSDHDWREYGLTGDASNEFMPKSFDTHKNYGLSEKLMYLQSSDQGTESTTGKLEHVEITSWTGTKKMYRITTDKPITIIEKTMYFPGWTVLVNGSATHVDSKNIHFPGRVMYNLESGEHFVESFWSDNTWDRKLAMYLSLLGIVFYFLCIMQCFINMKKSAKIEQLGS